MSLGDDVREALASLGRLPADEARALGRILALARSTTGAGLAAAVLVGPDGVSGSLVEGEVRTCPSTTEVPEPPDRERPGALVARVLRGAALRIAPVPCGPAGCEPAFLGVPLRGADDELLGALVLVREAAAGSFGDAEEAAVAGLALRAGAGLETTRARAHAGDLEQRLARATTSPSLAVPGDLDPADAVERILDSARAALGMELAFVSRVQNGWQRLAAFTGDNDGFDFEVGVEAPADEHYCHHMLTGQMPHLIQDAAHHPITGRLAVTRRARMGAYAGVPLRLPDGRLFGALCATSHSAHPELGRHEEEVLHVLAAVLGEHVARLEERENRRRDAIGQVRALLAPGGMNMAAQPVVDLRTGEVVGVEALARFPGRGGPAEVFAGATTLGVGPDLELAAVSAALPLLGLLPQGRHLAVNVSPVVAVDPRLERLLFDVDCERVVLELTEHVAVEDYSALVAGLARLRRWGVRVAVDDAGSGFASLRHVLSLAPDVIKLDLALVRGVDTDPARRALAAALVGFARELGATLVAEGIETDAELATLKGLGVAQGQGFLLGRPVPATELADAVGRPAHV